MCQIRLEDPRVSGEHAAITWDGGRWLVRDLSSRNGTWVDGERLAQGEVVALVAGAELGFGGEAPAWRLGSVEPPGPMASSAVGAVEGSQELLALPNDVDPEVLVFLSENGTWRLESGDGVRPCASGELIWVQGAAYRLDLPVVLPATMELGGLSCALSKAALRFRVSTDEEHVELVVEGPDGGRSLGARAHHYLLLTLARAWSEDAALEDPPARPDRGWRYREDLMRMLRLEPSSLNVAVHRARKQFEEAGIRGAAGIVERRMGTGQLRLAGIDVTIETLA